MYALLQPAHSLDAACPEAMQVNDMLAAKVDID